MLLCVGLTCCGMGTSAPPATGSDPPGDRRDLTISGAALDAIAARGIAVPRYDRTRLAPRVAHIGVGGFHRAHLAAYTDEVAAAGSDWGIGGIGLLGGDAAMADALGAQDGLYTLVVRDDEATDARLIGSLVDYTLAADAAERAIARLAAPDVAIVSLTITEGGYAPDPRPTSTFGVLAAALDRRRRTDAGPVTVMSCDNVPDNGGVTRHATLAAAAAIGDDLVTWIERECSFPNSMVDRITPVTVEADREWLRSEYGVSDRWPVVAEPFRQWVLEDHFVAGRPPWEDAGAMFSDDVALWELYKLRLLNAAHSCLSYLSALAGIVLVDEAMREPVVARFVRRLLLDEAVPSLTRIPGHPPEDYADTALRRFANTQIRDRIARLCIDGTSKFPSFLVPSIEHQVATGGELGRSALALAGWARYLGTVPVDEQAHDAAGEPARRLAARARRDPAAFLELDAVFTEPLRESDRFRDAFVDGYRLIASSGPMAAMSRPPSSSPAGDDG